MRNSEIPWFFFFFFFLQNKSQLLLNWKTKIDNITECFGKSRLVSTGLSLIPPTLPCITKYFHTRAQIGDSFVDKCSDFLSCQWRAKQVTSSNICRQGERGSQNILPYLFLFSLQQLSGRKNKQWIRNWFLITSIN